MINADEASHDVSYESVVLPVIGPGNLHVNFEVGLNDDGAFE
jgi:hypothetical protein